MLALIALVCVAMGLLMMCKYAKEKQKEKEKKEFVVLVGAILFMWFAPGLAFFIIGVICLVALFSGYGL
jgi:Ca2+/Na+ antiporter